MFSLWPILFFQQGFQDFDPFIPVKVDHYTDKEFYSCLSYYLDRNWLQRPEAKTDEGWEEIKFLSAMNPHEVQKFVSNL